MIRRGADPCEMLDLVTMLEEFNFAWTRKSEKAGDEEASNNVPKANEEPAADVHAASDVSSNYT